VRVGSIPPAARPSPLAAAGAPTSVDQSSARPTSSGDFAGRRPATDGWRRPKTTAVRRPLTTTNCYCYDPPRSDRRRPRPDPPRRRMRRLLARRTSGKEAEQDRRRRTHDARSNECIHSSFIVLVRAYLDSVRRNDYTRDVVVVITRRV